MTGDMVTGATGLITTGSIETGIRSLTGFKVSGATAG